MLIIFGIVTVIALVAATTAGIVIIKKRRCSAVAARRANREQSRRPTVGSRRVKKLPVRCPNLTQTPPTGGATQVGARRMLDHVAAALSARQASETASSLPMPVT